MQLCISSHAIIHLQALDSEIGLEMQSVIVSAIQYEWPILSYEVRNHEAQLQINFAAS